MSKVWKRAIGLGEELTWATPVAPTTFISAHGASTLRTIPTYIQVEGTRQTRGRFDTVRGAYTMNGEIPDIEIRPDEIDIILKAGFGAEAVAAPVKTYTLFDGVLPSLTIEENKGDAIGFIHRGVKIQELSFSAAINEIVKCSLSVLGERSKSVAVGSLTDPVGLYSDKDPFILHRGTFKRGGVELLIFGVDFTINNALKEDNFTSGSLYTAEPTEGVREVSGSFTLDTSDDTKWEEVVGATEATLEFELTNGTDTLDFEFPLVVFQEIGFDEGDQDLVQSIDFMAYRDDAADDNEVTAILTSP